MGDVAGADPVVVNRFLSWGLGALCATLIVLAGSVTITVPPTHALVQVSMMGVGLLGSQLQVHISSPSSLRSPTSIGYVHLRLKSGSGGNRRLRDLCGESLRASLRDPLGQNQLRQALTMVFQWAVIRLPCGSFETGPFRLEDAASARHAAQPRDCNACASTDRTRFARDC